MSRYTEKRTNYKTKNEERKGKFGFEYNEDFINYKTEIPIIPEKPRHRPDNTLKERKINQIQQKIETLKEERKLKKEKIKQLNRSYDDEINEEKRKIELAIKCGHVLASDLQFFNHEINKLKSRSAKNQRQIQQTIKDIRQIKYKNKGQKKTYKPLQEMTTKELDQKIRQIQFKMSTVTLSKRQEAELNNEIIRIGRIKLDTNRNIVHTEESHPNHEHKLNDLELDLANLKLTSQKIKAQFNNLYNSKDEIQFKIDCIKEDHSSFIEEIKRIAELESENTEINPLKEQSKALKEQIYQLRQQIIKVQKDFEQKVYQYSYEQEKINWINWATNVQEQKREEWQIQKAERKKQKLREKTTGVDKKEEKKTTQKTDKKEDNKQEVKQEKKPEERKRINQNQKQIDICSFLVDYCKGLYPNNVNSTNSNLKKQVDINEQLKKGAWAKEKGIQVLQSKKQKKDEEETTKGYQKKKQQHKEEEIVPANRFSHSYIVASSFDLAKILPPNNVEELDKVIKQLEDKLEYYLSHPNDKIEKKFAQDRKYVDKHFNAGNKEDKNTKSKGLKLRVVNSEDFPSLT